MRAYGLDRNSAQLLAVHQHNEAEAAAHVIARLAQGQRVAYVSVQVWVCVCACVCVPVCLRLCV